MSEVLKKRVSRRYYELLRKLEAKFAPDDRAVFHREESPDTTGQDGR